jgi:hypothetical protein
MKKVFLFFLFFLFLPSFLFSKNLEIDYPSLGFLEPPSPTSFSAEALAKYILYLYKVGLVFAALLSFFSLGLGAIFYLTSTGNVAKMVNAKEQMLSSFFGLLILLSSYLLLKTIYPQFLFISPEELPEYPLVLEEGAWLCPEKIKVRNLESLDFATDYIPFWEDIKKNLATIRDGTIFSPRGFIRILYFNKLAKKVYNSCVHFSAKGEVPYPANFSTKVVYFLGNYAAVLHSDFSFQGGCLPIWEKENVLETEAFYFGVKSLTLIKTSFGAVGPGVTFYQYRDFNEGERPGLQKRIFRSEIKGRVEPITPTSTPDTTNSELGHVGLDPCYSIKIEKEKNWVAIAFQPPPPPSTTLPPVYFLKCEVFDTSDRDLADNYVATFCRDKLTLRKYPCVWKTIILKGSIVEGPTE